MNKAPTFQVFWDAYALKRDRIAAERAWNRLTVADRRNAIAAIPQYTSDCQQRGIRRMYAQGYLSHRRWEDDFMADPDIASGPTAPEAIRSDNHPISNNDVASNQSSTVPTKMEIW